MGSGVRKAVIYLADQLEKRPTMQGYVLRRALVEADDTLVVVQNSASREIYENMQSPNVIEQMLSHKPGDIFDIAIVAAPGNLLELTGYGLEVFNTSLAQSGIQEGYRDDVLYLLTKDFEIKGRDQIIATAKRLKAAATNGSGESAADYRTLLSRVIARVEQELPSTLRNDLFAPVTIRPPGGSGDHLDSDGQAIPPFLLLGVDLIQRSDDGKPAVLGGFGIKAIREFIEHGIDFQGRKADAFLILSNFPILENQEGLFFDLIKNNKNLAIRVGAVLALRNDVFDQGLVCQFLSTLLNDPDKDVQYAAMLALASSDQFAYLTFQMEAFPTDDILSRIDVLMHTGFQIKMITPIVRVLSRSPYIRNPKVHELRKSLRNLTVTDPVEKEFYEECLRIIDAASGQPDRRSQGR